MTPTLPPFASRGYAAITLAVAVSIHPLGAQSATDAVRPAEQRTRSASPQASGILRQYMDVGTRPQDDFFRYVNGSWLRTAEIPAEYPSYGAFSELRRSTRERVRSIVEDAAAGRLSADPDARRLGTYYSTYLDSARSERLGLEPLRPELMRIAALRQVEDLPELIARLQRLGVQAPFLVSVMPNLGNSSQYVAYVQQGGLGLPDREYYVAGGEKMAAARAAYTAYAATLLRLAGREHADSAAAQVIALEARLAERQWSRTRVRDLVAQNNPLTVAGLDSLTPAFSWARYAREARLTSSPVIIARQPDYLRALGRLVAETPIETWRAYFTVHLLDAYAEGLSAPFVAARFAYRDRALNGIQANRPRWERAVVATDTAMGEAVGRLYVQRHLPPAAKARIDQLVRNLAAAFKPGLEELEWMTPETKAQARAKLDKLGVKIAHPPKWRDYSTLDVRSGDLIGNLQRARAFEYDFGVGRVGRPVDPDEWRTTPQVVNAYYNPLRNEIVFPAGILQPPFFDPTADDAVNYGAIGAVIGHEIGHAFDDQGRKTDSEGNLRDWWTAADASAYQARADRLAAQYDSLAPLPGARVNGRLTLGENIGDLTGVTIAHRAYRASLAGREAPRIDELTGDQRFFVGWAQVWRTKNREDYLRQVLVTNPHAPSRYRVNQVLRNLPAFHEAFEVRAGDPMYLPEKARVRIW